MQAKNIKLFPQNVTIPQPSEALIRSKIIPDPRLDSGFASEITESIVTNIAKAMEASLAAKEYISFVFHHFFSKIHITPKEYIKSEAGEDAALYIDPAQKAIVVIADDNTLSELQKKSMLHEPWHAFWYYLHNPPITKRFPKCHLGKSPLDGTPFTPRLSYAIETHRQLVSTVYVDLRKTITNLEDFFENPQKFKMSQMAKHLLGAIVEQGGYVPDKYPATGKSCTRDMVTNLQKGLTYPSWKGNGYTVRLVSAILTPDGPQCFVSFTCSDSADPICQTIAWAARLVDRCGKYEKANGVSLTKPLSDQLSLYAKKIFLVTEEAQINFDTDNLDVIDDITTSPAITSISFPSDTIAYNAFNEVFNKYFALRSVILECDAVLVEHAPAIQNMPSYQKLFKAHQAEVVKWLGPCSNGTALRNIPLPIETPVTTDQCHADKWGMPSSDAACQAPPQTSGASRKAPWAAFFTSAGAKTATFFCEDNRNGFCPEKLAPNASAPTWLVILLLVCSAAVIGYWLKVLLSYTAPTEKLIDDKAPVQNGLQLHQ